ncbi:MAG: hypothetical protein P4L80_05335 [Xanthobacteraceae bacterium]|nr:hypothetical protein [Xanthobacteraceae bacterium]
MIAVLMLIALAGAPPAVDAAKVCSDAQATALPEDAKVAFDSCVRDEQAARDKLTGRWTHYSATARSACIFEGGGVATSNVELWTCLEMQPGGSLSLQSSDNAAAPALGLSPLPPHGKKP